MLPYKAQRVFDKTKKILEKIRLPIDEQVGLMKSRVKLHDCEYYCDK